MFKKCVFFAFPIVDIKTLPWYIENGNREHNF